MVWTLPGRQILIRETDEDVFRICVFAFAGEITPLVCGSGDVWALCHRCGLF